MHLLLVAMVLSITVAQDPMPIFSVLSERAPAPELVTPEMIASFERDGYRCNRK